MRAWDTVWGYLGEKLETADKTSPDPSKTSKHPNSCAMPRKPADLINTATTNMVTAIKYRENRRSRSRGVLAHIIPQCPQRGAQNTPSLLAIISVHRAKGETSRCAPGEGSIRDQPIAPNVDVGYDGCIGVV